MMHILILRQSLRKITLCQVKKVDKLSIKGLIKGLF